MKTFFISDLHFGHGNIINFDSRPFSTIEEMDSTLIDNWNSVVSNEDLVYILGDISWYNKIKTIEIVKRLNGRKVLIKGNHDYFTSDKKFQNLFEEITDYKELQIEGLTIILSHFPIMMWNKQRYGAIHLYGHVHNSQDYSLLLDFQKELRKTSNYCFMYNVGCMIDYMGYTPRTLEEIIKKGV